MTRFVFIILAWMFSVNIVLGKNSSVAGDWLLIKVEAKDGPQEPYMPVSFKENGDFELMGMKMGTWEFDKKAKTVKIVSQRFKEVNGDNKILKLGKEELIWENAGTKMYFRRMDKEKIVRENTASGLMGTWQMSSDDPQVMTLITFKAPDDFSYIKKEPGITTNGSGTWIYSEKDQSLILIARIEDLENKYSVKNISAKGFVLENNGKTIQVTKAKAPAKIEHLTFKQSEFFDDDGNFKYENEESKLPWKDAYSVYDYLKNVKQLTYKYSTLVKNTHVFQSKDLVANVHTDVNGDRVCIDFIFHGYDKAHLPEDTSLPPNCISDDDYYNRLFPESESDFRVAGKEDIITPAGTFHCTVIESLGDRDQKYKMWMIDDKPGVYAKIIEEDPDEDFGYYHVYELQGIK